MITVACIVSTTACGAGNSTNRAGSDTSDSVMGDHGQGE